MYVSSSFTEEPFNLRNEFSKTYGSSHSRKKKKTPKVKGKKKKKIEKERKKKK